MKSRKKRSRRASRKAVPANVAELRQRTEAAIEALIGLLDCLDAGDADKEPDNDDEPSFGWTDFEARYGRYATPASKEKEIANVALVADGADFRGGASCATPTGPKLALTGR